MMETWISVPGSGSGGTTLFTRRDDNGRVITPGENSMECKENVERNILSYCVFISVGQRCADWFVLSQFRVTGKNAGKTLLGNESVPNEVGYTSMVDLAMGQETQNAFISFEERILALSSSWFRYAISTESMMRGTSNEALLVNASWRKEFVKGIFEVEIIVNKD
jgi:hypothetical protein